MSSSSSLSSAGEDGEAVDGVGVGDGTSRTMSAWRTVHTSQRAVRRGSCKILGRRSS